MRTAILELDGVTRCFGSGETRVTALEKVDLRVEAGEMVAVMGPSGSGKSTLLGLAGGLDTPTSGRVLVDGADLGQLDPARLAELRRRKVGFVFQDFNLVPSLTAVENVALPLELDHVGPDKARMRARMALERVGVDELSDRSVVNMSGGQRQRVAIARALVGGRKLLLADEPTGALDSRTGDTVLALLHDLADDGMAIVLVTHEARHASWARRVVFLRDGRIIDQSVAHDDPAELLETARRGSAGPGAAEAS